MNRILTEWKQYLNENYDAIRPFDESTDKKSIKKIDKVVFGVIDNSIFKNSEGFVIEDGDGGIAGYILLQVEEDRVHIRSLASSPDHQNKGIATRLLNKGLSIVPDGAIVTLCIDPNYTNRRTATTPDKLRKFYTKFGFSFTKIIPSGSELWTKPAISSL